ncbi:DUF2169 family type VI secretion system accessory protein [Teredinibacter haidensis]|uniref:DUF2169 family type VI secretion system accessory protein n=1 Tax=Teredinibacter haidensis TaxID=2731755 RepID=UPI000948AC00|nr:DUF2169 domain-containing protein [Teredinibacter haidensis]
MLQLNNNTPFAAEIALFPNADGVDTLFVMVKAGFKLGSRWTLLNEQMSPQAEDEYYGEPAKSSLKRASDFHPGKPNTDIIMSGSACAPEQKTVEQLDVSLSVGNTRKTVRVFGDRQWRNGTITKPVPFTTMPLVYENAFGGLQTISGKIHRAEERNPVGKGYRGSCKRADMESQNLPNLEDPGGLIQDIDDTPVPACFAPVAPNWQPRVAYAGTYDEKWEAVRAPYLPGDYDARFMNSAHPDLVYPGYLQGGEPLIITGMHPGGSMQLSLPVLRFNCKVRMAVAQHAIKLNMESLLLEPNQLKLYMVWRAALVVDKDALNVEEVFISLSRA